MESHGCRINSYELGSKGTYFNNTLRVNADLFYTVYTDYQIQSYQYSPGDLSPPLNLSSVGKASTRGLEFSGEWLATATTRLNLGAAYIDAKFDDYANAPVSGDTMPNSPKLKANFGVEQRVRLFNGHSSWR